MLTFNQIRCVFLEQHDLSLQPQSTHTLRDLPEQVPCLSWGNWWFTFHGFLLKYSWYTTLCRSLLYSIVTQLYTSVQFSRSVMSKSLWPHGQQHTRPPCPSPAPEFTQTHVHWVGDTIQPSYPLSSHSPPAFNLSQRQGLSKWVSSSHQVAEVLEFQLQVNMQDWFPLGSTGWISLLSKGLSRVFSNTTVQNHQLACLINKFSGDLFRKWVLHSDIDRNL